MMYLTSPFDWLTGFILGLLGLGLWAECVLIEWNLHRGNETLPEPSSAERPLEFSIWFKRRGRLVLTLWVLVILLGFGIWLYYSDPWADMFMEGFIAKARQGDVEAAFTLENNYRLSPKFKDGQGGFSRNIPFPEFYAWKWRRIGAGMLEDKYKAGDLVAGRKLAQYQENGVIPISSDEHLKFLTELAQKGDPVGQLMLARALWKAGQPAEALPWFEKSVGQNEPEAAYCLGEILLKDNPGRAFHLFQIAASDPTLKREWFYLHAWAQLANCYDKGIGTGVDHEKAFQAFQILEDSEGPVDAEQYFRLGTYYEMGWGTSRNFKSAITYFKKAADEGSTEARKELARMGVKYQADEGVD